MLLQMCMLKLFPFLHMLEPICGLKFQCIIAYQEHTMSDLLYTSAFELLPFFELTPDLVCIAGKDGYFRKVNQSVIDKLGYSKEELFSRLISSFIHPDDREITQLTRLKMIEGQPLVNFQNRYIHKNGSVIWLEWTSIYFADKEVVFAIAKDVTRRKETELQIEEKYIRFKGLANHFKGNIERDRKYLSVELHEELAQLLAVLKIDIDWIKSKEAELPDAVTSRLEHAGIITDMLIETIQRISFTISPGMLSDLGLVETLRWHCNEFSLVASIDCRLMGNCNDALLGEEMQLDLFRICQEALHNILYHAEATVATLTITETDTDLCFVITDNGKGFDVDAVQQSNGLTVMKERAASINAGISVTSKPGRGTEVNLKLKK
jgi:PAS domain S-box-containing protein